MDDLEKLIEDRASELVAKSAESGVYSLIDEQAKKTDDVKKAIDLLATKTALEDPNNIDKIVEEKSEELRNDAETKRIHAETEKISKEVERVKQEKEKQLAELDKIISAKQKEVDELKAESDKEDAYFERNKEILKYVNVRKKKTLKVMHALMFPASIVFFIVQVLLFPITLGGIVLENIVTIVGSICGEIKNNLWKIVLSTVVVMIVVTLLVLAYYFGIKFVKTR